MKTGAKRRNKRKICIAQINYNSKDIQGHVEKIKDIINKYKAHDLLVFPELILQGHPSFEKPEGFLYRKMKVMYSAVSKDLYQFIMNKGATVIIGEVKRWGERYYNVATYIDKYTTQSYTKTHVHWTENFVPGRELKVFTSRFGKIGINICFDAAFSEVWRVLSLKGSPVIVNISAVPRSFPVEYMWRRFAGAAIYNQVYVVYANRPGPSFSGHSAIFDPKGDVVASSGPDESIIRADINLNEVKKWREQEQLYPYRRPLLYRKIVGRHDASFEESMVDAGESRISSVG